MKERTKAYMAGLMDAEGCFGIYKEHHKHFTPHIILTSSFLPLTKWLVKHFGGICSLRKYGLERYKPYFHWQLNGRNAAPLFVQTVLPYLKLKKDQAEVLLQFFHAKEIEDKDLQQILCDKIKALKSEWRNDRTLDGLVQGKLVNAYLAGFFDGEGSISLYCHRRPTDNSLHYIKFLSVTNTDSSILRLFQKLYGGDIRTKKQPGKQCFEWNLRQRDEFEKFLLYLLPYLIIKRDRAKLMLNFVRIPRAPYCPAKRYEIYQKMRAFVTTQNANPMVQSDLTGDSKREQVDTLAS